MVKVDYFAPEPKRLPIVRGRVLHRGRTLEVTCCLPLLVAIKLKELLVQNLIKRVWKFSGKIRVESSETSSLLIWLRYPVDNYAGSPGR